MKRKILLSLVALAAVAPLPARTKAAADSAYARKDYAAAAAIYEEVLEKEPSAAVYYDLAGAYFRMDNLPEAILNYERACRLDPSDEDIRFNLELCRNRTADRFGGNGDMFFVTWAKRLAASRSYRQWGGCAVLAFALGLLSFGFYFFGRFLWLRKAGFSAGAVCLLAVVAFNVLGYVQYRRFTGERKGVIFTPTKVHASPSPGARKVRELHEGATVLLLDGAERNWQQVELPDGTGGWIDRAAMKEV